MQYNYNKLLGKIKEKGFTQRAVAEKLNIKATTFSQKLNNKAHFKQSEIANMCALLDISDNDIGAYFFTHKV